MSYGTIIISDKEFKFELTRAKKDGKLKKWYNKKIIIFDDAINKGKHIKEILNFLKGEEDFETLFKNIKIGAYIANEKHLDELKAKLKEEYGNELIEDTLIGQKVNEHLGDLKAKLKEEYGNEL